MRRLLAGLALALLIASPVAAQSTIALDPSSDLTFAGYARFDVVIDDKLKGYEYPLVLVKCYQAGEVVYATLGLPDATFDWSSGSNQWVFNGGGPADCTAQVWAYPGIHRGKYERPLSEVLAFHVAG